MVREDAREICGSIVIEHRRIAEVRRDQLDSIDRIDSCIARESGEHAEALGE